MSLNPKTIWNHYMASPWLAQLLVDRTEILSAADKNPKNPNAQTPDGKTSLQDVKDALDKIDKQGRPNNQTLKIALKYILNNPALITINAHPSTP